MALCELHFAAIAPLASVMSLSLNERNQKKCRGIQTPKLSLDRELNEGKHAYTPTQSRAPRAVPTTGVKSNGKGGGLAR